jgi:hypothetical protein
VGERVVVVVLGEVRSFSGDRVGTPAGREEEEEEGGSWGAA